MLPTNTLSKECSVKHMLFGIGENKRNSQVRYDDLTVFVVYNPGRCPKA